MFVCLHLAYFTKHAFVLKVHSCFSIHQSFILFFFTLHNIPLCVYISIYLTFCLFINLLMGTIAPSTFGLL